MGTVAAKVVASKLLVEKVEKVVGEVVGEVVEEVEKGGPMVRCRQPLPLVKCAGSMSLARLLPVASAASADSCMGRQQIAITALPVVSTIALLR